MLATLVIAAAAALPLGVWPQDTGDAAVEVDGVEFYLVEPEDDYSLLAVQPLIPPLTEAKPEALRRLAHLAARLGADAVLLLPELSEDAIPKDPDAPLPRGKRFSQAVFLSFDSASVGSGETSIQGSTSRVRRRHRTRGRWALASAASHSGP
jgi:hypothetical protein